MLDILGTIRQRQATATSTSQQTPKHLPEMLYIGCVDARLDPIADIGIEKGKALIFRNIGALVLKDKRQDGPLDLHTMSDSDEIPQSVSIGAALEFFLNHIPQQEGLIKHIVISGHTDCNGLKACQHGTHHEHDHYLPLYLESLKAVRAKVLEEAKANGWDDLQTLHALEKESVRQSMANLLTYPVVRRAIEAGTLEIHGWVLDTTTKRISEMNLKTLEFEPMGSTG